MICYEKCPTGAISADITRKQKAFIIEENCIGCSLCKKRCPVGAIEGEIKGIHKIDPEKCIGCGECMEACPKDTIIMKPVE
jgi:electron transport complex protein RnfB